MVKSATVTAVQAGVPRELVIAVGKSFRVTPDARLKHYRGRLCTITDFNALLPSRVQIIFENGQRGAVKVSDLAEEIDTASPVDIA